MWRLPGRSVVVKSLATGVARFMVVTSLLSLSPGCRTAGTSTIARSTDDAAALASSMAEGELLTETNRLHRMVHDPADGMSVAEFVQTREQAARRYELYLSKFRESDRAHFAAYYYAELLLNLMGRHRDAARYYLLAITLDRQQEFLPDCVEGLRRCQDIVGRIDGLPGFVIDLMQGRQPAGADGRAVRH